MSFKKINIKNEIKLTIPSGGELDDTFLDFKLGECMKEIFTETSILTLPRYITTTASKVQELDVSHANVSMHTVPTGMDTIRFTNLYEVTWIDGTVDGDKNKPSLVESRTLIDPNSYYIGFVDNGAGDFGNKIIFYNDRTAKVGALELWSSISTTEEKYVDEMFSHEFYHALLSKLKYYIYEQAGKPWTSLEMSNRELIKYREHLSSLKYKSSKSFGTRNINLKPVSFI